MNETTPGASNSLAYTSTLPPTEMPSALCLSRSWARLRWPAHDTARSSDGSPSAIDSCALTLRELVMPLYARADGMRATAAATLSPSSPPVKSENASDE